MRGPSAPTLSNAASTASPSPAACTLSSISFARMQATLTTICLGLGMWCLSCPNRCSLPTASICCLACLIVSGSAPALDKSNNSFRCASTISKSLAVVVRSKPGNTFQLNFRTGMGKSLAFRSSRMLAKAARKAAPYSRPSLMSSGTLCLMCSISKMCQSTASIKSMVFCVHTSKFELATPTEKQSGRPLEVNLRNPRRDLHQSPRGARLASTSPAPVAAHSRSLPSSPSE
mmetsp:Transcript_52677/g.150855  ORF Transcript_52677/g.150855 Transcript_52677/m.150855 type:complete len:231 (+) Transcript_52677:439-1131(+)